MRQQTITTDKPLISIIVPVYKVEAYLEQCLDSILQQTWKKLDIILIDDGSPDSCGQICDRYAERDPRVRVFHTDNHGLSSARNLGIKKACAQNGYLRRSLTTYNGYLTHEETSGIQNKPWVKPEVILNLDTKNMSSAPKNTSTTSDLFYKEYKDPCKNGQ